MAQVKKHHSNENHVSANGNAANVQLSQQVQRAQLLNKITTHFDKDFDQQIQHGLNLVREEFNFDNAIISHIEGDDYIIQFIDSSAGNDAQGHTLELGTTYCNLVQSSEEVVVINHASESEYKEHPCYQATKLESYIGAPLYINDQFYGTVTFSTLEPYPDSFTEIDVEFIKTLANWISGVLTRKQTAANLNETLHEMESLYQYTAVLNESTTLEEAFRAAIQPSIKAGASSANLLKIIVDNKNQPAFLDMLSIWPESNEVASPVGSRFDIDTFEISKYWLKSKAPILIGNIAEDERFSAADRDNYKQVGIEATVIYPLITSEKWVGVISLNWSYPREFTAADERQYRSMATQTASVLNNLLLSEQEHKRAQQLETVAEVSAAVANILDPEEFLQTVVNLTRDQFSLYHAHIYLYDPEAKTLTLRSGAGEIGRVMVVEGRTIHIEQEQSLVARAARTKKGFIINDVKNEPSFLSHPLLPHTASEMAVPIMRQDEILGVLDVQSNQSNNFSQD
ncbi:MAG: GAF domain-containing protein, partial [Anaerolineales bacterium]|nr:GAF domain-containing protein [Anaerolineales bacterium]